MNVGRKSNIIIAALAVVILALLVQSFVVNGRMEALASQVSALQNDLSNASAQLYDRLASHVDEALRQAQSLVEAYEVSYGGVDAAAKTVKVHLSFRLKDVSQGAKITVYARPSGSANEPGDGFEAATANGVDFTGDFALSYLNDYSLDIYQTDASGNSRKLNADSMQVYIKSEFENRTSLPSGGTGVSAEGVEVDFQLENRTFGQKDFRIKKVEMILLAGGREVARKDVTERSIANSEDIEQYNLMAAAGDTNISDNLPPSPEIGRMQMDPKGVERGYFVESFPNEEIHVTTNGDGIISEYGYAAEVTYENGTVYRLG